MTEEKNRRILVIDDNPAIHTDFRKILAVNSAGADLEAIEASTIPGIPVLQHASIAKDPSPPGPSLRLMTVLRI